MRRSRPAAVKIGPYQIRIAQLSRSDAETDWGNFSARSQQISLSDSFPTRQIEAETVLHEILHALWWSMHVKQKDGEERIVSALGVGVAQIVRDNPELIDWLVECLADERV